MSAAESQKIPLGLITAVSVVITMLTIFYCISRRREPANVTAELESGNSSSDHFLTYRMEKFLNDIESGRPIRFTSRHLTRATNNYSNMLGSGGFGSVYKGTLGNGTVVAVKVLHSSVSDKRMEEQFMAEVSTIGRVHHFNLVRLLGFCIETDTRALVYEYMCNGSLDKYLFCENKALGFGKLHEIAVGTAKGIAYLHEECNQRIIHYDIKPENILLDHNFCPKVADFGLAKLYNREKSCVTMTGLRGTPGYAAPELWMPFRVTHKCDVFSFGMLLFEIIGRRRNLDVNLTESQEWFPRQVWIKFESEKLEELIIDYGIFEDEDKEIVERMARLAFWCVQYRPELRPIMSVVVKMLEGSMDIPDPSNPFQHWMEEDHATLEASAQKDISINVVSSNLEASESSIAYETHRFSLDGILPCMV